MFDSSSLLTKYNTVPSCDLEYRVKIKVGCLEGRIGRGDFEKLLEDPLLKWSGLWQRSADQGTISSNGGGSPAGSPCAADLRVDLQVYDNNVPICLPVSTSYKAFSSRWNWNEWITLPLRFSDLPRTSILCFTVYDCCGPSKLIPVGGTAIKFFGKNGLFRQGMLDLRVWPGQVGDGNDTSLTPGKGPKGNKIYRLTKMGKKHRMGQIPKLDWLDRLTFSEIETLCEREKRESDFLYLNVEFPIAEYGGVQYAITFGEKGGEELDEDNGEGGGLGDVKWLPDHEIVLDNLVENKHHTLSRCTRTGSNDVDLKPNAAVRDSLNKIVNYPPTKTLSAEEQDLIWKFRHYLSSNKKALAKFLKCVKWEIPGEEGQALELLGKWTPMDVQDALELLGPSFAHKAVRAYAVERLRQAPDEDLMLYLLQLVQALKYENVDINGDQVHFQPPLQQQKQQQAPAAEDLTQKVEDYVENSTNSSGSGGARHYSGDEGFGGDIASGGAGATTLGRHSSSETSLASNLSAVVGGGSGGTGSIAVEITQQGKSAAAGEIVERSDLATFLIQRACENTTLANYFYWYLLIEVEDHEVGVKQDPQVQKMYYSVMQRFWNCMKNGKPEWQERRALISRQQRFIAKLVEVVKTVMKESANRQKKMEKLQALLAEEGGVFKTNFAKIDPLPFPLDPEVKITGIVAKEAILFKSSQMPCRLTFSTESGSPYVAIFKHGDDLRQDQLILQIITLMDRLLSKENLDLKLTPYRVLATSTTHGFVQFIQSTTVAEVLSTDKSIHNFFRKWHPSETEPYGIEANVMDTYVKSCAGYCVITYLLGVGDRHLDNLLLTRDGNLFHIDFGYILGRDPKYMPPPMKLSKEMVEAMGGLQSEHYQEFRKLCYTAFLHLRRHANLILNLFSLMVGASVPDIALEPDKTVKKVLDKFRLELNDEGAVKHMQELIDTSVTAVMPAFLEHMHTFTQMLRK